MSSTCPSPWRATCGCDAARERSERAVAALRAGRPPSEAVRAELRMAVAEYDRCVGRCVQDSELVERIRLLERVLEPLGDALFSRRRRRDALLALDAALHPEKPLDLALVELLVDRAPIATLLQSPHRWSTVRAARSRRVA